VLRLRVDPGEWPGDEGHVPGQHHCGSHGQKDNLQWIDHLEIAAALKELPCRPSFFDLGPLAAAANLQRTWGLELVEEHEDSNANVLPVIGS
jgi:hypothetical protein